MSIYKDKQRNTWFVVSRYKDWTGKVKQTTKRDFKTKYDAQRYELSFIDKKKDTIWKSQYKFVVFRTK